MKNFEITIKYTINYADNKTAIGAEFETLTFTAYTVRGAVAKARLEAAYRVHFFYEPLGVVVVGYTAYPKM